MQENRRDLFLDHLRDWLAEKWEVAIFCNNEGEQKRLEELLREAQLPVEAINLPATLAPARLRLAGRPAGRAERRGDLWPLPDAAGAAAAGTARRPAQPNAGARLHRDRRRRLRRPPPPWHRTYIKAVTTLPGSDANRRDGGAEVLVLEFAEQSKLYVPVEQSYLVSKYVGVGKRHPALDVLGGSRWERAKISAQKAVMDYAAQLLSVQAERDSLPGHRLRARQRLAEGIRGGLRLRGNGGPATLHPRDQARHGGHAADGPAHLRRRRLRQDGGGDPRRVQGGAGRTPGRLPRADDDPGGAALEKPARALRRLSRSASIA